MTDTTEMNEVRQAMKALIFAFSKVVDAKARQATRENGDYIKKELQIVADDFAKKHSKLQSRYMDLMFYQDLQEMAGTNKAELFARFMMSRKAGDN